MATDWTTKEPNIPFKDASANGAWSVVIVREYDDILTAPDFRSVEYLITNPSSIVKQGVRTILETNGKEWPALENDLGTNMSTKAMSTLNGTRDYAASLNVWNAETFTPETYLPGPPGTPVPSPNALLATVGMSPTKFQARAPLGKHSNRGLEVDGPFFPPRPGINIVLFKVTIGPEVYQNLQDRTYPTRYGYILARGPSAYKEIEFKNFEDLSNQLEDVSAALKEYETKHKKLQAVVAKNLRKEGPRQYIGPELGDPYKWSDDGTRPESEVYGLLNLEDEAEKLDNLKFKIKDFLQANDINLDRDKFTIGFYKPPPPLPPDPVSETSPDEAPADPADATDDPPAPQSESDQAGLPTITSQETANIAYTNKYKVSSGDTLWDISKFYTGNGMRYKDLMSVNKSVSPYSNRGWLTGGEIGQLKRQLDVSTNEAEKSALKEKIRKGEKALIYPGDILGIPSTWLDEIAEEHNWPTQTADGQTIITYSPTHFGATTPPETTATDDGVNHAALDESGVPIDPWVRYDSDSEYVLSLDRSRIAYIKRSTKNYDKTSQEYKNLKKELKKDPENPELKARVSRAEGRLEDVIIDDFVFLWRGFLSLVHSKEYEDPRTADFLTKLDVVIREPGVAGALLRLCNPGSKPPKKAKTINQFVKKYIYDPPPLKDIVPSEDEIEAWKRYIAKSKPPETGATSPPKTIEQVEAQEKEVKSSLMKKAVARRNKKISSQAGDMVFDSLPHSVNKINSLDDVHKYVLSRLSLPTMAEEILKCLGLGFSIDDLIEMLCDGFLKTIGADPDKIDELFELLRIGEFNFEIKGIELFDTAKFAQDIQQDMAAMVASGVNDPFYSAMIKQNIGNARGKRMICEIIMGAIFAMASLLASLGSDWDPRGPNKRKCKPRFEWPSIPHFGALLPPIYKQLEKKFYQWLEKLIRDLARDIIENIIEFCAEDDPVFGSPPPPILDPVILDRAMAPLQKDPREFLAHLLSTLTANELCRLVEGVAEKPLLLQVRKFMKRNYSEHFDMFSSDYKIFSFFKSLQGALDLSACPLPRPQFSLDNLCKDGVTPREQALRNSLLAKGLSPEEVEAQMSLDKKIKGEIVSDLVGTMFPTAATAEADAMAAIDMNSVISKAKSLERGNNSVINSTLKALQNTIYNEIGYFVPTIFSELERLRKTGLYDFQGKLPTFDAIEDFADETWENKISFMDPSDRNVFTWTLPRIQYTPGQRYFDPNKAEYVEVLGTIEAGATQKTIRYDLMSYNNILNTTPKKDDIFFFSIRDNIENEDAYVSRRSEEGVEIKDEDLKERILAYPVTNGNIPRQIDVFAQFLKEKIEAQYGEEANTWYGLDNLQKDIAPTDGTPWTLSEYFYGLAFTSIIDRMLKIILTSEYFDITNEGALKNLDLLGAKLGELEDIKKQTRDRVQKLQGQHDFTSGEPPTYLGESLIEASARSLIKFNIIQNTLRAFPVFAKFRVSDAFSDIILEEYINNSIKQIEDGKVYGMYRDFMVKQEEKLRRTLETQGPSSKPPLPILSETQINEEIKKQIFGDKADNAEDYIMSFIRDSAEDVREKILDAFGNVMSDVDERMETREATGLTQDADKLKLEGTTSEDHFHVHTYTIDEHGDGKTDPAYHPEHPETYHEHTITGFVVQPATSKIFPPPETPATTLCDGTVIETPEEQIIKHAHLLERKVFPSPIINSITTVDNEIVNKEITDYDDAEKWQKSPSNHIGTRGSTCMLESLAYPDDGGTYAVQIPPEVTLPPGTNWDPHSRMFQEMSSPKYDELPTTSTKFIGNAEGYYYNSSTYNSTTKTHEVSKIWQPASVVQTRLVQCELAAEYKFKKYYGGLANPYGESAIGDKYREFTGQDSWARWNPLFHSGVVDGVQKRTAPNLEWTEENPFSPFYGMYFWWSPYTKKGAEGHILKIKATHKYGDAIRPRNAAEFESHSGEELVEGVPRALVQLQKSKDIEDRNLFFGDHGQQNPNTWWEIQKTSGVPYPLIQLRVPTRGSDNEINIEEIKEIKFKINGDNFQKDTRVLLVAEQTGNVYELKVNVDSVEKTVMEVSIPIRTLGAEHRYIGDDMDADRHDVIKGHGHIDFIDGIPVVDDIFTLQARNPKADDAAVAPLWFHTFTTFGRGLNTDHPFGPHYTSDITNSFKDELVPTFRSVVKTDSSPQYGTYPWPKNRPEAGIPFIMGPRRDEGINQIFALPTFGNGSEGWDVLDVADATGISRRPQHVPGKSNYQKAEDQFRTKVLCVPRLTNDPKIARKIHNGGFILEKYIKLKFKNPNLSSWPQISENLINPVGLRLTTGGAITHEGLKLEDKDRFEYEYDYHSIIPGSSATTSTGTKPYAHAHQKFAIPGLAVPAWHHHILSYNAFMRLTEKMKGYSEQYSDDGLPVPPQGFTSEENHQPLMDTLPFSEILDYVSYGLRLSYITPMTNDYDYIRGDADALQTSQEYEKYGSLKKGPPMPKTTAYIKNMFNPSESGTEFHQAGTEQFNVPSSNFIEHLIKTSSKNKAFLLTEYNGIVPGIYGEPAKRLEDIIDQDVYVIPLVDVELPSTDPAFPSRVVKTFENLRAAYPTENQSSKIPFGKEVYDELYIRLKTHPDFKLLFDYIIPTKRALSIATIYNMLSFDSIFPDPCKFQELFSLSHSISVNTIERLTKDPTGLSEIEVPNNPAWDTANMIRKASGFGEGCADPRLENNSAITSITATVAAAQAGALITPAGAPNALLSNFDAGVVANIVENTPIIVTSEGEEETEETPEE